MSERSGTVIVLFAVLLLPLILLIGANLDIGAIYNAKNNYQRKFDAIAVSAAHLFIAHSGKADDVIRNEIGTMLDAHLETMVAEIKGNEKLEYRYQIDTKKKTVTISGRTIVESQILKVAGHETFEASLESVAKAEVESQPVCILALGIRDDVGIRFFGDGKVKAKDCVIWSNADGPQSIKFNGRGKVESESLCAVGRAGSMGQFKAKPPPQSGCQFVKDPLSRWSAPSVGSCTYNNPGWIRRTTVQLNPGVYCGGLRVDAKNINLRKGLYIIKDGPLILRGSSKIKGKDVGIFLTGEGSYLDIDGKSKVEIHAPTEGPMAGIAIAADSSSVNDGKSVITGRSDLKIGGIIYFPNQRLVYWGESNTWAASPVTTIIADSIEIGGKAYLEVRNDKKKAKYAPIMETGKGRVILIN